MARIDCLNCGSTFRFFKVTKDQSKIEEESRRIQKIEELDKDIDLLKIKSKAEWDKYNAQIEYYNTITKNESDKVLKGIPKPQEPSGYNSWSTSLAYVPNNADADYKKYSLFTYGTDCFIKDKVFLKHSLKENEVATHFIECPICHHKKYIVMNDPSPNVATTPGKVYTVLSGKTIHVSTTQAYGIDESLINNVNKENINIDRNFINDQPRTATSNPLDLKMNITLDEDEED